MTENEGKKNKMRTTLVTVCHIEIFKLRVLNALISLPMIQGPMAAFKFCHVFSPSNMYFVLHGTFSCAEALYLCIYKLVIILLSCKTTTKLLSRLKGWFLIFCVTLKCPKSCIFKSMGSFLNKRPK